METSDLKQKLESGKCVYGPFVRIPDPAVMEILGYAGFDFAIIDLEHGPMGVHQAENLVRAGKLAGMAPVIRIRENAETMIVRALDTGASAVQIPQINTAAAAQKAARAARFYPRGMRGVCAFTRNAEYSNIPIPDYFAKANENTLTILQIEGCDGLNDLDAILEVQRIDVLFIGPYDLSQALGVPGEVMSRTVLKAMETITAKARAKGVFVGSFSAGKEALRLHRDMGVQYLSYHIDGEILLRGARMLLEEARG